MIQKRIRRLSHIMRLMPIYQTPDTRKHAKGHETSPCPLGGLTMERSKQLWCADTANLHMLCVLARPLASVQPHAQAPHSLLHCRLTWIVLDDFDAASVMVARQRNQPLVRDGCRPSAKRLPLPLDSGQSVGEPPLRLIVDLRPKRNLDDLVHLGGPKIVTNGYL